MELLQKFASVEIQVDRRITEMDKNYCERHQKAYETAISSFQELAFFWADMNAAQTELLGDNKSPFYHNYLASRNGPSISEQEINQHIESLHIVNPLLQFYLPCYSELFGNICGSSSGETRGALEAQLWGNQ